MRFPPCAAHFRAFAASFLLFALLSPVAAQTLWVSATRGSDNNPGTAAQPFRSITKGLATAAANGLVLVDPGTYSFAATGEVFPLRIPSTKPGLILRGRARDGSVNIEVTTIGTIAAVIEADRARMTALQFRSTGLARIRIGSPSAVVRGARFDGCRLRGQFTIHVASRVQDVSIDNNLLLGGASIADLDPQSSIRIEHNTIASLREFNAAGIRSDGSGSRITNNLITKRRVGVQTGQTGQAAVRFVANNVFDCVIPWSGISAPPGNFSLPPFFMDPGSSDYRLQDTSALIGRGSSRARNESDVLAFPRALDGIGNGQLRPDIGCYEHGGPELFTGVTGSRLGVVVDAPRAFGALLVGDTEGFLRVSPLPTLLIGLTGSFPLSVGISTPFRGEFQLPTLPADARILLQGYIAGLPLASATNRSEAVMRPAGSVRETFTSDSQLDRDASSGSWGSGTAAPGRIGGSGRHGSFALSLGRSVGNDIYEFDTDNLTVPAERTRTGQAETIRDGLFEFTDFRLPANATVRFVGSKPPVIRVCGAVDVRGRIQVNADTIGAHNALLMTGQLPSRAGPGGSRGGAGGARGDGQRQRPEYFGQPGEDVGLTAGHVYAQRALRTGGRRAVPFPLDCLNSSVNFRGAFNIFSDMISAGGGGGGLLTSGGVGRVVRTISGQLGQTSPGGVLFDPLPVPRGISHVDHFLIGGSGGGGGATHPFGSSMGAISWRSGAAGGSGGGALALRSGRSISITSSGSIESRGGSGPIYTSQSVVAGVGGGGSGGSIVLQTEGSFAQSGLLDVRGGSGTKVRTPASFLAEVDGGDGAGGFVRVEVPNPQNVVLGNVMPPAVPSRNAGALVDQDDTVAQQSKWYNTTIRPLYLRYEVDAMVNNRVVRYSDDPSRGVLAGPGADVEFFVQGAKLDANGDPLEVTPWFRRVGAGPAGASLADEGQSAFRFALQFNRAGIPSVDVRRVEIFFSDVR